jgi:transcription factor E
MPKKTASDHVFEGFVKDVAGAPGLKVVKGLGKEGGTDEKIELASGLKLAVVRSLLNQLNYHGIVEYTREKNMQSGWFTYTWRVNKSRAMQNFLVKKKVEYEALRKQINAQGEGAVIYNCPKGCGRVAFDKAMDTQFACGSCSTKLKFVEGSKELRELETRISALETILGKPNVF